MNWSSKLAIVFSILSIGSVSGQTSFTDVTNSLGLGDYRCYSGDLHSPGGVFTDLNNDGYADLYLVNSDGASGYNRLYLNVDDGNGGRTFSLQSGPSGNALGAENPTGTFANDPFNSSLFGEDRFRGVTGAIAGDYDNDGDLDLYVTNMGLPNRLYQNQLIESGTLSFTDVTTAAGGVTGINLLVRASDSSAATNNSDDSLTAVWFDPDRDGDLDLYVGNHSDGSDPVPFEGAPDTFYINNGDGTFTDSTAAFNLGGHETANGSTGNYADTNIVASSDINNDGWPDLIVTNKSGRTNGTDNIDQIYINDGVDADGNWLGYTTMSYSLVFGNNLITRSAMGMAIADIDNDGDMDIFISDNPESRFSGINGPSNLFVNQLSETGNLSFVHGLVDTGLSWGVQIQDFDNDGDMEIHTTNDASANNGYAALLEFVDLENLVRTKTNADNANTLFQGNGTVPIPVGDTIANVVDIAVSAGAGNFNRHDRGNIAADFNRDGLVDMFLFNVNSDFRFVPQTNDPSVLLMNNTNTSNNFLNVKLVGSPDNLSDEGFATSRDAVGSRVIVSVDGTELTREVYGGYGNASSTSSYDQMFGVGQATEVEVSVIWADGRVTDMGSVATNQFLVIDQDEAMNMTPMDDPDDPPTNQIYFESFDGPGGLLNDTTEDLTGELWAANGFATDNGVFNVGPANMEGSATLPITLVADMIYTVQMDVTTNAAEWIGIGFSENGSTAVANRAQDRFAQSGGRAWMLIRPGEVGANALGMQVEIFGGGNTANVIADLNTDFSGPTAVQRTLTVVLNTDSAGFTADFLIDGVSQSMGPQPLFENGAPLTDLTLLSNVGFTWEGQSGGGVAGAITVDNFSVSDNSEIVFPLGDVTRNGVVDFLDLGPFIQILSDSQFQFEADITGNGVVDFLDLGPFIAILSGN